LFSPQVPTNFFRISFVLNFEPPVGLRASIQRTYSQFFSPSSTEQAPAVARNRLYFLLSLLHAIILERKRYIPLGWSKQYEFSDADLMCGMCLIKEWMDRCAIVPNRTETPQKKSQTFLDHIDPSSIPFDALCTLLLDVVYGGRMDNVFDYRYFILNVIH
jgi:dynein heavy chain 1, cytosolic